MKQCSFFQGGIVCHDRARIRKCEFCHQRDGANQCDYPTGGKCKKCSGKGVRKPNAREQTFEASLTNIMAGAEGAPISVDEAREALITLQKSYRCHDCAGTGKAMCNRYFCGSQCGLRVSEDEGYCPDHLARSGRTRPPVKERCWWLDEAKFAGRCLRASCNAEIEVGERCLYFPERRRVMDSECGEEYLRVAVEV